MNFFFKKNKHTCSCIRHSRVLLQGQKVHQTHVCILHMVQNISIWYDTIKFVLVKWMMRGKIVSDTFWFINYFPCIFMRISSGVVGRLLKLLLDSHCKSTLQISASWICISSSTYEKTYTFGVSSFKKNFLYLKKTSHRHVDSDFRLWSRS